MRYFFYSLCLAFFLVNCSPKPPAIEGVQWELVSFNDGKESQAAVNDMAASLSLSEGKLQGHTGCNQMHGSYKLTEGKLVSEGVAMTKKYCQPTAQQEQVVTSVLQNQPEVSVEDGQLVMRTEAGQELVFEQVDDAKGASLDEPGEEEESMLAERSGQALQTSNKKSLPAIVDDNPPMRGMFAYLADAAIFINCADGERYPVAMAEAMPDLQKAYLRLMGEEAGRQALATFNGRMEKANTGEDDKTAKTVIVEEVISLTRAGNCETDIQYFQGNYTYMADAAHFFACDGKDYPVALEAAQMQMEKGYVATGIDPPNPAFATVEGFIAETEKMDGPGTEPTLHILRLLGFDKNVQCP